MKNFFNTTILFLFIYNIAFKGIPSILSTGKIAFLIICVIYLIKVKRKTFDKDIKKYILQIFIYGIILIYAFCIFIFVNSSSTKLLGLLIYYIVFAFILPLLYKEFFKDSNSFLKCFMNATFIQGMFIVVSFFSEEFRIFTNNILVNTGNISLLSTSRVAGFTNGASATLSLIQGLGLVSLVYCIKNKQVKINILNIIKFISIFLSIFFTGKTGFIIFAVMLVFILTEFNLRGIFKSIALFCIMIVFIATMINVIDKVAQRGGNETMAQLNYLLKRNLQLFDIKSDSSLMDLKSMEIPQISNSTIIGTGLISDSYGRNASGHDSGYIQIYYSLGLPMSIIFYLNVLFQFIKSLRLNNNDLDLNYKKYLFGLILVMFIIEYKEPFITKQILPFYIFMLVNIKAKNKE